MDEKYPKPNKCLELVTKAYAVVDDPSTDSLISWSDNGNSFIVWNEARCCKDLLPRLIGIPDFTRFLTYGFKRVVPSEHMEFAREDFVRGKPELLEKIGQEFLDRLDAYRQRRTGPLLERMMRCKNQDERDLVVKDYKESKERERRGLIDKSFLMDIKSFMQRVSREKERREQALVFMGAAEHEAAMLADFEVKGQGEKRKTDQDEDVAGDVEVKENGEKRKKDQDEDQDEDVAGDVEVKENGEKRTKEQDKDVAGDVEVKGNGEKRTKEQDEDVAGDVEVKGNGEKREGEQDGDLAGDVEVKGNV